MELQHLGWNLLTFTLCLALCCTATEGYGLYRQKREIWQKRSGKAVSVPMVCYLTCLYFVTALYGFSVRSVAMTVDGAILGLSCLPIVSGLWKFRGFTRKEQVFGLACLAAASAILWSPRKDVVFLVFCLLNSLLVLGQIWEMWKEKSTGVVSITLLWTFFVTGSAWTAYAFVFNDLAMKISFSTLLVATTLTIATWYHFREPTAKST